MEAETITGLKKALEQFPDARAVSIDTWGVDWAPLDENGELVGDVVAYRDERTARTLDAFRERIGDREFFDLTGNQPATINTANQLFAYLQENPADAQRVAAALFLPDYFAYRLTGVVGWSRTIASTSGLLTPGGGDFSDEVFNRLGIPRGWFGELAADRTVVGPCTVPASRLSPSCAAVPTTPRARSMACPSRRASAPTSCPAAPGRSWVLLRISPS